MSNELPKDLKNLFAHVEKHKAEYIETLREVCAIKSVSAWPDHRKEIQKMVEWTSNRLKKIGCKM